MAIPTIFITHVMIFSFPKYQSLNADIIFVAVGPAIIKKTTVAKMTPKMHIMMMRSLFDTVITWNSYIFDIEL